MSINATMVDSKVASIPPPSTSPTSSSPLLEPMFAMFAPGRREPHGGASADSLHFVTENGKASSVPLGESLPPDIRSIRPVTSAPKATKPQLITTSETALIGVLGWTAGAGGAAAPESRNTPQRRSATAARLQATRIPMRYNEASRCSRLLHSAARRGLAVRRRALPLDSTHGPGLQLLRAPLDLFSARSNELPVSRGDEGARIIAQRLCSGDTSAD